MAYAAYRRVRIRLGFGDPAAVPVERPRPVAPPGGRAARPRPRSDGEALARIGLKPAGAGHMGGSVSPGLTAVALARRGSHPLCLALRSGASRAHG